PDEVRRELRHVVARVEIDETPPGPHYPADAREVALDADGVAARRVQAGGIDHARGGGVPDMFTAGTVAAFAAHTIVGKRRVGVAILRIADVADLAGMTP